LRWFVGFVGWVDRAIPILIAVNLVACCAVLFARAQAYPVALVGQAWLAGGLLASIAAAFVAWLGRPSVFDALLRMETALRLDNRLTTAQAGLVRWPPPRETKGGFYRVRFRRQIWAFIASAGILGASALIPAGEPELQLLADEASPPLALAEVESWIERLKEEDFVEERAVDELRESVEALKERPPDEWYTAGAMEAAENLNERTADALKSLARDLQPTSALLSGAPELPPDLAASDLERIQEVFRESVASMQSGALPLSSEMLSQLGQVDFQNLGRMDPKELEKLRDRSEHWAQACKGMTEMTDEEAEQLRQYCESLWQGGAGERERASAPGGIQRGRGDAEMSYSRFRSDERTATTEGVSNTDLGNAAIGDTVRTTISDQKEDASTFGGPQQGGTVDSPGAGGEAVWIDRLTPAERKVLRGHFN